jgi:hypothetical protein
MNFIKICIFLFAVMLLGVCAEQPKDSDLNQMMRAILNDPEFLSLNVKQQLRILVEIYNILERKFAQQNDFKDKKSTNVLKIHARR